LFGTEEEVSSRLQIERMGRIFLNELGLSRSFVREREKVSSRFHIERFGGRTFLSKLFSSTPYLSEVDERLNDAGKVVADVTDLDWIIDNSNSPEVRVFKRPRLRFVFFGTISDTRVWYLRWTERDGFSEGSLPVTFMWHRRGRIVLKRQENDIQML
jgi:hypothetical protein